jgi:hypothetical protein
LLVWFERRSGGSEMALTSAGAHAHCACREWVGGSGPYTTALGRWYKSNADYFEEGDELSR